MSHLALSSYIVDIKTFEDKRSLKERVDQIVSKCKACGMVPKKAEIATLTTQLPQMRPDPPTCHHPGLKLFST
jgi:hypothetical protein